MPKHAGQDAGVAFKIVHAFSTAEFFLNNFDRPDGSLDDLLSFDRSGQRYFCHTDDLGTVKKVTGATGGVVEQYTYGDFGAPSFAASINAGCGLLVMLGPMAQPAVAST